LGAITGRLLEKGVHVLALEKDKTFVEILKKEYEGFGEAFEVLEGDALKVDLKKELSCRGKGRWKFISNLPYYITTPILMNIFEHSTLFSRAVCMMQKEVADRFVAKPSTKDYGRLTLAADYFAETRFLFEVSRGCFTPKPAVASSVLAFDFKEELALDIQEQRFLFKVIKLGFSQRRKMFIKLLTEGLPALSRALLEEIFTDLGWEKNLRGESLSLEDYQRLCEKLLTHLEA